MLSYCYQNSMTSFRIKKIKWTITPTLLPAQLNIIKLNHVSSSDKCFDYKKNYIIKLFIIWYIPTENYITVDTSHITARLCNQYYWFNNTSGKGLESRLFQFGSYLVALDIEKDNSRAGQRIHIVCLIFENEEGRNKTGFYYSVCVFSRICERVSCVESVIFFLQILHTLPTFD